MKTRNKHIWLSSLLTAMLLFQWGFTVFHVFTSHTEFHSQNKVDNSNEVVYGADYDCDLCTKLNTKPTALIFAPKIAFIVITNYVTTTWNDSLISTLPLGLNLQRGPPYIL
ncbi:hypothetical protein [Flagellimonas pacifica]|uniref:DUF2946 domain-containing protein n=1 Tax=Flagellimonas pacifica TaxID=1247520 RepID=A0A285MVJ4_9FLAO|nr:hypothetical protein [Allomuricauda parva]SNY99816.1 hypothetical protein SAMN06265377_1630 [Allomuricauda parva]